MRKKRIVFLSCLLVLTAMNPVVNAKDSTKVQNSVNKVTLPFDDDPFFQFNDEIYNQIKTMQQTMNGLVIKQFNQNNNNRANLIPLKSPLSSDQAIQMEERNNELIYQIKLSQGNDSKVDVSVKKGVLIINMHCMQKISQEEKGSKTYSYLQSNYRQMFKLPKDYDPNSIDIKSKDANLIVTFKKKNVSHALKI